ncbi:hypothetical protein BKA70DRAFT_1229537 [Coprinopsis sp. MPI-PUGE-AT-0042]|nr:hypothetical protein BKA70DRAFT_1229537 [Coprinopsis sp. MPI-PUGE-AT-0042]
MSGVYEQVDFDWQVLCTHIVRAFGRSSDLLAELPWSFPAPTSLRPPSNRIAGITLEDFTEDERVYLWRAGVGTNAILRTLADHDTCMQYLNMGNNRFTDKYITRHRRRFQAPIADWCRRYMCIRKHKRRHVGDKIQLISTDLWPQAADELKAIMYNDWLWDGRSYMPENLSCQLAARLDCIFRLYYLQHCGYPSAHQHFLAERHLQYDVYIRWAFQMVFMHQIHVRLPVYKQDKTGAWVHWQG